MFGYTKEKGDEVFPRIGYPRCSDYFKDTSPIVHLDYSENTMVMNCSEGGGKYVLGPVDDRKLVLRHEIDELWQVKHYSDPVAIPLRTQFALATCDSESEFMDHAVYKPRYNATLHQETKTRMETLKQKRGPLVILMMVVDSYSRNHFYRKLPQTVEWLNQQRANYSVVDFLIHNIIGTNSVGNQAPIFGRNIQERYTGDLNTDFAGEEAIWHKLKQKVSVT